MAKLGESRERLLDTAHALMWREGYSTTSVDDICAASGLKKGSFYHHFASKEALTIAAVEAMWEHFRPQLDLMFSPLVPPLARIAGLLAGDLDLQRRQLEETGLVCGCPLFTLGTEFGRREPVLKAKVAEMLGRFAAYLASALREAQAARHLELADAEASAWQIQALREGAMTLARIHNDLRFIVALPTGVERLLGVALPPPPTLPPFHLTCSRPVGR